MKRDRRKLFTDLGIEGYDKSRIMAEIQPTKADGISFEGRVSGRSLKGNGSFGAVGETDLSTVLLVPEAVWDFVRWHRQKDARETRFVFGSDDCLYAGDSRQRRDLKEASRDSLKSPSGKAQRGQTARAEKVLRCLRSSPGSAREVARRLKMTEKTVLSAVNKLPVGSVTAPDSVRDLERQLLGAEICRIPLSPYQIVRNYWRNMISVRRKLSAMFDELEAQGGENPESCIYDTAIESVVKWLRQLHITATMGENLDCYYRPLSPVSTHRVEPGRLSRQSSVKFTNDAFRSYLGGIADLYDVDLYGSGFSLKQKGQLVYEAPRPLDASALLPMVQALLSLKEAVHYGDLSGGLVNAAIFHREFVRLHLFACGNQCIAMNVVNFALRQLSGMVIPHLYLDYCAFALPQAEYIALFRNAVEVHQIPIAGGETAYRIYQTGKRRHLMAAVEILQRDGGRTPVQKLFRRGTAQRRLMLLG